jgi:2-amino-4-hydroxy-6-hydroxymethyldihydropteridine diphosphokinase
MNENNEEHLVYLGLGSNIDPEQNLPSAVSCLGDYLEVVAVSSAWQTPAVGSSGDDFLNAVILVRTMLPPTELKQKMVRYIEDQLGRIRSEDKYADRTIDIDLLIRDTQILDPEIWVYAHMAVPLSELNPSITSDITGETIQQAAQRLSSHTDIKHRPDVLRGFR